MRTIVDNRRIASAAALAIVAAGALATAWVLRPADSPVPGCNQRTTNEAVLECVAERAARTSPGPIATVLTVAGVGSLMATVFLGRKGFRRVMTLHDAAQALNVSIPEVRQWVDQGILESYSTDQAHVYLDPKQVGRLRQSLLSEVAASGTGSPL